MGIHSWVTNTRGTRIIITQIEHHHHDDSATGDAYFGGWRACAVYGLLRHLLQL